VRSKVSQPIDKFDLAWIAHVASMWALRELVAQIGHFGINDLATR